MREILFRGKDSDGVWHEGFYVCHNGKSHAIYTGYAEVDCGEYYPQWFTVDPSTVGQYTGLTDKNGKNIFEGDIVHCYGKDSIRAYDWKAVVEFGNPNSTYSWGWQLKPITDVDGNPDILLWVEMSDYMDIYCEVIGNIHDNPELLEGTT